MLCELYGVLFLLFFTMLVYNMLYSHSPLVLITAFILSVCGSTYYYMLYMSAYISYLLFLVYIGGLLVLLIYLIMVSLNYMNIYSTINLTYMCGVCSLLTSLVLMFSSPNSSLKLLAGSETLDLLVSSLVVLGALLLYIFLNVCSSVVIGGRSLTFGV
uniref:NADH dehydrogenase subunit 6 n=1 Tax=Helicella itala TaxID=76043 RepID=A0A1S5R331_9EUPU|nr:NADH dehydrogenase subunit 6 [Helicella itala]